MHGQQRTPVSRASPCVCLLIVFVSAANLGVRTNRGRAKEIFEKGGAHYRDFGMGRSRGTMPIQLAGNIKHGGLVERAFGLTLRELVEEFGGGTYSGRPVRAVQVGGPLGAYWPTSLFDVPLDYEAFAGKGGMVGHGGVVVFDDTVNLAKQARFAFHFCAVESCGKCTPCRIGSIRGAETIDKIMRGERVVENIERIDT